MKTGNVKATPASINLSDTLAMPRAPSQSQLAKRLLAEAKEDLIAPHKRPATRTTWKDWEPALLLRLQAGERPILTIDWFIAKYAKLNRDFTPPKAKSAAWQRFAAVVYRLNRTLEKPDSTLTQPPAK